MKYLKLNSFTFIISSFLLVGLLFIVPGQARASETEDKAAEFIQTLAAEAISSLTNLELPKSERVTLFRKLFTEKFAYRSIGKFVLGRNWRKATDEEKSEYFDLFEDLMVVSYVERFASFSGQGLDVQKTRLERETIVTVFSTIARDEDSAVKVAWRVAVTPNFTKVIDVIVESTSMSNTLRSEFGSIIKRRGGKIAGLLEELREKTTRKSVV